MKKNIWVFFFFICSYYSYSQSFIIEKNVTGSFPIVSSNKTVTIVYDDNEDSLIYKSAYLFQKDIEMVSGKTPALSSILPSQKNIIIIGSIGTSRFINQLVKEKKLNLDKLKKNWEAYNIQVVHNPFQGIDKALVIAGSDRRGTAYGVFELSKQIGVSPWYWWADVPVKKKKEIYLIEKIITDAPTVKYRGIFINDEAPALSGWSKEKFGGFNHSFYEKVFELMLRLKANYLWPAMWGNAFYDDDKLDKQTADNYGIVIGTSHHEPLMRAHDEWRRYGKGKWNYDSNEVRLKEFWKEGMQRATNEKIVSIGMRGDGDEPMSRETATSLLERIVKDQRNIIEIVTGKPASQTPQLWALYKEVQDYYDKGMRVPDDVTLLLCDDNWGNIRKLPKLTEKPRNGGYGIYYHFDYVGGPRNYKWINTNNIARVWEQMHLAYEYGVDKIWIVNVGDIKPMEFPINFFLDYAWNPKKWNEDNLRDYYTQWAVEQFGEKYSKDIGYILRRYSQYSARIKPELLNANTYSINYYNEAEKVLQEWDQLLKQAEKINNKLSQEYKDAFFQLLLHPINAYTNLLKMYNAVALNQINAKDSVLAANYFADKAKELFKKDSLFTLQYHRIVNGKWNHMMDQTHIGYTYWQQPDKNKMPAVFYLSDGQINDTVLNKIYNVPSAKKMLPKKSISNVFYEEDGYVSIQSAHYTKAINTSAIHWKIIPDIGRDGDGITTFPVTAPEKIVSNSSPRLEYEVYVYDTGTIKLQAYISPTLNFHNDDGLKYAISIDDEKPQIISINKEDNIVNVWEQWVANNIIIKTSQHKLSKQGKHVVKYWMVSPAVILQKIVLDIAGVKQSYLGPPETKIK